MTLILSQTNNNKLRIWGKASRNVIKLWNETFLVDILDDFIDSSTILINLIEKDKYQDLLIYHKKMYIDK